MKKHEVYRCFRRNCSWRRSRLGRAFVVRVRRGLRGNEKGEPVVYKGRRYLIKSIESNSIMQLEEVVALDFDPETAELSFWDTLSKAVHGDRNAQAKFLYTGAIISGDAQIAYEKEDYYDRE